MAMLYRVWLPSHRATRLATFVRIQPLGSSSYIRRRTYIATNKVTNVTTYNIHCITYEGRVTVRVRVGNQGLYHLAIFHQKHDMLRIQLLYDKLAIFV